MVPIMIAGVVQRNPKNLLIPHLSIDFWLSNVTKIAKDSILGPDKLPFGSNLHWHIFGIIVPACLMRNLFAQFPSDKQNDLP